MNKRIFCPISSKVFLNTKLYLRNLQETFFIIRIMILFLVQKYWILYLSGNSTGHKNKHNREKVFYFTRLLLLY